MKTYKTMCSQPIVVAAARELPKMVAPLLACIWLVTYNQSLVRPFAYYKFCFPQLLLFFATLRHSLGYSAASRSNYLS
jgi:hypothetical protein